MATRISGALNPALDLGGNVVTLLRSVQLPGLDLTVARQPGDNQASGLFTAWQAEVALGAQDAWSDWIMDFMGSGPMKPTAPMAGAVLLLDGNNGVSRRAEFFDAELLSLSFAPLVASDRAPMTAQFSASASRFSYAKPGAAGGKPSLPSARRKAVLTSAFRIDGLPFDAAKQLLQVQLPTLQRLPEGPLQLGELELVFSGAPARDAALAWVLQQAQAPLPEAQDMVVELLDAAQRNALIRFKLQGCLPLAYAESAIESGSAAQPSATLRFSVASVTMEFTQG